MKKSVPAPAQSKAVVARPKAAVVSRPTRGSDRQYLPHADELLATPPRKRSIWIVWALCLILTAGTAAACLVRLDIYAVANGHVEYVGRSKIVQPSDNGRIHAILVRNGTRVRAGQTVAELDTKEAAAALAAATYDLQSVDAEIARRETEILVTRQGKPCCPRIAFPDNVNQTTGQLEESILVADLAQLAADGENLLAQMRTQAATRQRLLASNQIEQRLWVLAKQRFDLKSELVKSSSGTITAALDAQEQVEQGSVRIAYNLGLIGEADAATTALRLSIDELKRKFIAKHVQALQDARLKREDLIRDAVKARVALRDANLVSPIDGTVQQLAVTNVGQVVFPGQALMVVTPTSGPLTVEAFLPGPDIGFVAPGQTAVIKAEAFPFVRYGTFSGRVTRIARDAVDAQQDLPGDASDVARDPNATSTKAIGSTQRLVFPISIQLVTDTATDSEGKKVSLLPGMTVTPEIKTGSRSLIAYILSPLTRALETP